MSDFGNFCLLVALCLSLYSIFGALLGARQKQDRIVRSAERAALAACASITLGFLSLVYLLVASDFSVAHVANASNRDLPVLYKIAALWGAHDGSMVLWVFFTGLFSGIVICQNRFRYRDMMPYVIAVLMVNLAFFLALTIFLSNPFNQLVEVGPDGATTPFMPADGRGLNPLLQYWAMIIHPPVLYVGFIGFVIPFAFAIAALITRQLGDTWMRTTRRWTLVTWLFLGIGLILGGKWAYVELGWGGYWAWDPVENSSLMPWLIATAFLHSVIVQERKGMLKVWNMLLVTACYFLGVFGTFLTRSGIVNSVHAFADSNLGEYFIYYMILVLAGSLYLIFDRLPYLKSERSLDSVISRESAFLFNNLILVIACFAVFWGTMFPAISEWAQGTKITVGPPFFNAVNIPIGLFLLFLTGVGPLFAWRQTSVASLKRAFLLPSLAALLTCAALLALGMRDFYAIACFTLSAFVVVTIVEEFYKAARIRGKNTGDNFFAALVGLTLKNKRRYGGYIVHLSVVLIFVGIAGNAFNREATRAMVAGDELEIGSYTLRMAGYEEGETPNYSYGRVALEAFKNGKLIRVMKPEKRFYKAGDGQSTTEVELYSTPREDLYVIFAGISGNQQSYEITVHVNPLVWWVWFGTGIMFFGTLITLLPDGRRRLYALRPSAEAVPALQESMK